MGGFWAAWPPYCEIHALCKELDVFNAECDKYGVMAKREAIG